MAGIIKSKLEGLSAEVREQLDNIVTIVMGDPIISVLNEEAGTVRVKTDNLAALIELLTEERKKAKAYDESVAEQEKEQAKAVATANGADMIKTAEVGDVIEFTMGSGKAKTTFRRTIIKKSDKTVTVEFTDDYECTTSASAKTGKKFIKLAQITKVIKAEAVAA